MENRKEQIENLKNEIAEKQQTLNGLRAAEDKQGPENITEEQIKKLVSEF